jgi:hypothetical protein
MAWAPKASAAAANTVRIIVEFPIFDPTHHQTFLPEAYPLTNGN